MMNRFNLAAPSIPALFALALLFGALSAAYATLEARDLNADGSLYLIRALSYGGIAFIEPARKTVQLFQQSFSYAGFLLGLTDLTAYGKLLTLGMQGWPVLLTGIAWFVLPQEHKLWILGPLLNLIVFIPATNFIGIGEGILASCLMWILYFLVEFRMERTPSAIAAIVLAAACFYLHEAAFPFMMGIALLAFVRANRATGVLRFYFVAVGLLCLLASFNLLYFVFFRPGMDERGSFLSGLAIEFLVAAPGTGVNLPAIAGIAVMICLLIWNFPIRLTETARKTYVIRACQISGALFCLIAILFLAIPEWVMIPHTYFAGRGWPIVATMAMAGITHFLRRAGWSPNRLAPPPIKLVLAGIILLQLLTQTVMTAHWASYRRDLASLVATRSGIIPWQSAYGALNPHDTFFRWHFVYFWSVQPLSIVLAPDGKVRSAVDARPGIGWKAFQLDDPANLPLCALGFDWSAYVATLRETNPRAQITCPERVTSLRESSPAGS